MSEIINISSITQVHETLGLEKPKHPLVSVMDFKGKMPQPRIPLANMRLAIHLYQVTFKSGFEGSFGYGRNSYDFEEGTMIFTSPGQVIEFDEEHASTEHDGWGLLFHPDLIRKSALGENIDNYSFFSYDVHEALHVSDDEKNTLAEITQKIRQEYEQNIDKHSQKLIISNIELLLDYCTRYYDRQFYTRTNLNQDIFSRFEKLLKNYYSSNQPLELGVPSVSFCGKMLNISPNYLSDMLKKETGRNAQEHIHFFVIERAKNNLLNSNESVSQIAYHLGFEYPQHFSKIFKRKTGLSPSEYRSLN